MSTRLNRQNGLRAGLTLFFAFLFLTAVAPTVVQAEFLLKPSGSNAVPLRRKALTVNATLRGGLASVKQEMVFANETSQRTEADFVLTVPPRSVVTYFAYWFGKEKVVARVVEKERAAAIYQHITSRMRDPALIEMTGKNTFRARIFPVEPNADLKIEIHTVEPLASTRLGAQWRLPLRPKKAGTQTLEKLDVKVSVARDENLLKAVSNQVAPQSQNSNILFQWSRRNYRAVSDFAVSLLRRPRTLDAQVVAARSGGPDGFFSVLLASREALRQPRVRIENANTYQVIVPKLTRLAAHQNILIAGRYRGASVARIVLEGKGANGPRSLATNVYFSAAREDNNAASKIWAAGRIAELSSSAKNQAQVVDLSTRFTLPSKWTSWLAVPRAEMVRYREEKAEADMLFYRNQLAMVIRKGQLNTPLGRQIRSRFSNAARSLGRDPQREFRVQLGFVITDLYGRINEEKSRSKPSRRTLTALQREVARLERAGAFNPYRVAEDAHRTEAELVQLKQQLSTAKNSLSRVRLQKRIAKLSRRYEDLASAPPPPNQNGYYGGFRTGDPLISVEAPADAQSVVALLPDGEIKRLLWIADKKRWEARFDIPTHAQEGEYSITVVVVLKNGLRSRFVMRFEVDMTAPQGSGEVKLAQRADGSTVLRLEITASEGTTRAAALLPWNEKVDLQSSTAKKNTFFTLVPLTAQQLATWKIGENQNVTFVLTDRAHNRIAIQIVGDKTEAKAEVTP